MFIKSKNNMINLTTWAWTDLMIIDGITHGKKIIAYFRDAETPSTVVDCDTEEEARKIFNEIWDALKRNENFLDISRL